MIIPSAQKSIARILKVNHAGEYGAIRIYRSQILVSRLLYPEIVGFLEKTLSHEIRHCAEFRQAMPERSARPCRIMGLWGNGGYVLGFLTGLMGREAIWVCTEAVEQTVHRHLEEQLTFLHGRDDSLRDLILGIQGDELEHLEYAQARISRRGAGSALLTKIISLATELVIWLSTWGDSTRMAREVSVTKG